MQTFFSKFSTKDSHKLCIAKFTKICDENIIIENLSKRSFLERKEHFNVDFDESIVDAPLLF